MIFKQSFIMITTDDWLIDSWQYTVVLLEQKKYEWFQLIDLILFTRVWWIVFYYSQKQNFTHYHLKKNEIEHLRVM